MWQQRSELAIRRKLKEGQDHSDDNKGEKISIAQVDVCIFIDPLVDFLCEHGTFCKTYGLNDTANIRRMKTTLSELLVACRENDGIEVILVTSDYVPQQFKTIQNLCTTSEGTAFALTDADDIVARNSDRMYVLRKTDNSILACSPESHKKLLRTISDKNVMICGITSTACVNCAIHDLLPYCSRVVVTRDTIACRNSSSEREKNLIKGWGELHTKDDLGGLDGIVNSSVKCVRILDSWAERTSVMLTHL